MNSRLSKPSVIAMLMVAVMILGVFVFPLWVISLVAPQYPQGLGLLIHVDRIEGITPFDLQNINGLNHYIGMHKIEPGTIQELRYMKYFALGLAVTAALVALIRRRSALLVWALIALVLAGVGMYDFYKWEYRYGHDLDPSAAIKVPGMSYQPPMIGTKQLLNFRTTAYPGIGGWLAMIAVALGVGCVVYECWLRGRIATSRTRHMPHRATPLTASVLLCVVFAGATLLNGCTKKPATIAFGTDACEHCSMTITDQHFGAVLVTDKGRSYKFDSVECMLESLGEGEKLAGATVDSFYVMDYAHPGQIINASRASFLVSPNLPSPMGANVSSFAQEVDANHVQTEKGGDIMTWLAVQKHLQEWARS